jgi:hypothetical protein
MMHQPLCPSEDVCALCTHPHTHTHPKSHRFPLLYLLLGEGNVLLRRTFEECSTNEREKQDGEKLGSHPFLSPRPLSAVTYVLKLKMKQGAPGGLTLGQCRICSPLQTTRRPRQTPPHSHCTSLAIAAAPRRGRNLQMRTTSARWVAAPHFPLHSLPTLPPLPSLIPHPNKDSFHPTTRVSTVSRGCTVDCSLLCCSCC